MNDAEYEQLYGIPRIYRATGSCAKAVKVCEDLAKPVCPECGGSGYVLRRHSEGDGIFIPLKHPCPKGCQEKPK